MLRLIALFLSAQAATGSEVFEDPDARYSFTIPEGFVAQGSKPWGWYDPAWVYEPLGEIVVTVVAAAIVTVLCTPPVRRVFRFVMEPDLKWAFRGERNRERVVLRA